MSFSIFETLMLLCFGASWPFSIVRSYRARSAEGKSLLFLVLLELAYICGILHKLIDYTDIALALYIANFLMVLADIALYFRNTRLDKKRAALAEPNNECEETNL
jgi:hypothetical protein